MKLALSNLAFPVAEPSLLHAFAESGVSGIEVALTKIAPWAEQTEQRLSEFRALLADHDLVIPSLQSLLFGIEGLALLGDREAFARMRDHLATVARSAAILGAGIAVFGSPAQRSRGSLSEDDAFALGVERFTALAQVMAAEGAALGLEPVPPAYGGDFLCSAADVLAMVTAVAHPGLALHLDTGCVFLNGDDIADAVSAGAAALRHFHIAEPQLGDFSTPRADHAAAAAALSRIGYDGWIAIEMREASADPREAALEAITFARQTYRLA